MKFKNKGIHAAQITHPESCINSNSLNMGISGFSFFLSTYVSIHGTEGGGGRVFSQNASVQEEIGEWAWCWDLIDLCMYGYVQASNYWW